jgi:CBS domain containing-hemolysin-like protein
MTPSLPVLPLCATALTWLLLLLAAWDGAARRRGRQSAACGPATHDAVEVRLAAWPFFGAILWGVVSGAPDGEFLRGLHGLAVLLALVPAAALAALGLGIMAGRAGSLPLGLRWILTPYHGLAGWILWLRALARRRDLAAGSPEAAAAIADATEPEGSPRRGVRDLAEFRLEEVMIPRSQVAALQGSVPVREAVAEVRRRPHALYPVHGDSVDQPLGVVRILDLAEPGARDRPVRDLVRPAPILPETMRGLRLFRDLASAPIPAALVVDEYGGMAGLVTVEDLVEVLVGDLEGEHEVIRTRIVERRPGAWRVDGTCTIEEFNRRLGALLPEGEYETVAGLVIDRLGAIPPPGEEVILPGVRLTVEQATDRRVLWVGAERADGHRGAAESGA